VGCDLGDWSGITAILGDKYQTIAVNVPGHWNSTALRETFTIEAFASDVAAVLDAEGITDVVSIGHSMGGAVALEVAVRCAGVRRVIGVDSVHYLQVYPLHGEASIATFLAGFQEDFEASVDHLVELSSVPTTSPELKAAIRSRTAAVAQPAGTSALVGMMRWDLDAALTQVNVPVAALAVDHRTLTSRRSTRSFPAPAGCSRR
jgi:pimeloyl-ACP methyl ester carboxylesterase